MNKLNLLLALLFLPSALFGADAPSVVPLWPNGAPGFEERRNEPEVAITYKVNNIHNPSITVFLPTKEKATGAAILVCPGGGHRELGFVPEGIEPGRYFADLGVAAFALKYRLGREQNSPYEVGKHPREDGLRAMRVIRSRATEWGIDPARLGIIGFSAAVKWPPWSPTAGTKGIRPRLIRSSE